MFTTFVINFLLVIEILVSLLLVLLVLMQRPKSEGLGAAFGGGMTENLFGAQTTNVLQKATRWLGAMFFVVALVLSMLYSKQTAGGQSSIQQKLANAPAPKPENSPAPANATATEEAVRALLQKKLNEATGGVSGTGAAPKVEIISPTKLSPSGSAAPAPAPANTKTGGTPAPTDLPAPNLQLGVPATGTAAPPNDLQAPKLQLQTGTAADKKVGF